MSHSFLWNLNDLLIRNQVEIRKVRCQLSLWWRCTLANQIVRPNRACKERKFLMLCTSCTQWETMRYQLDQSAVLCTNRHVQICCTYPADTAEWAGICCDVGLTLCAKFLAILWRAQVLNYCDPPGVWWAALLAHFLSSLCMSLTYDWREFLTDRPLWHWLIGKHVAHPQILYVYIYRDASFEY